MDTPLHALAVPDADRSTLKRPETAAQEFADALAAILSERVTPAMQAPPVIEAVGGPRS